MIRLSCHSEHVSLNVYQKRTTTDEVYRVRLESERIGWARLFDLYQKYDQERAQDVKEDIDMLLVFVSLMPFSASTSPNMS